MTHWMSSGPGSTQRTKSWRLACRRASSRGGSSRDQRACAVTLDHHCQRDGGDDLQGRCHRNDHGNDRQRHRDAAHHRCCRRFGGRQSQGLAQPRRSLARPLAGGGTGGVLARRTLTRAALPRLLLRCDLDGLDVAGLLADEFGDLR